jgi:N-methylhydantoinase B
MPEAVAAVRDREQRPGVAWVLNDPFRGGTHLPDITLVSPVIGDSELIGFAASRAHHADVGGPTPASMPAASHTLEEEGVVIPPTEADEETLRGLAERMRNPRQRLADLRAQEAANRVGALRLGELATRLGSSGLAAATAEILAYAERRTRAALAQLPDGRYEAVDLMEDDAAGAPHDATLRLAATIEGDGLVLDFEGTDPQVDGNLNCPLAVTRSAAFFAVRVLTDPDAPASAGAYRPIEVTAPRGCLLNAEPPAAVAAGNVETSSRVADLVIAALGGGQGACPDADGPDAIHVAMSNTLNTPIEALETEFPLRLRELSLRRGSGGRGTHAGGDGIVRELEACEPMRFTLITERRRHAPRGRDGGGDGATGRNLLNGSALPSKAEGELRPGDVLRIETPGGGGFG